MRRLASWKTVVRKSCYSIEIKIEDKFYYHELCAFAIVLVLKGIIQCTAAARSTVCTTVRFLFFFN